MVDESDLDLDYGRWIEIDIRPHKETPSDDNYKCI